MVERAVLSIDAGTTGTRAGLVLERGDTVGVAYRRLEIERREGGIVEQDPHEILDRTREAIGAASRFARDHGIEVVAAAIAAQRLTSVLWDETTGSALVPAMVWQDTRYAADLEELGRRWNPELVENVGRVTGMRSGYLWAARMIRSSPAVAAAHRAGSLRFGSVDTWLAWNLCRERPVVTSATAAAALGAYALRDHAYYRPYLDALDVPTSLLPDLVDDDAFIGTGRVDVFGTSLPITALVGDQQAGMLGMGVVAAGQAGVIHGTGSFCALYCGSEYPAALATNPRALIQVARRTRGSATYNVETFAEMTGSAADWMCDRLGWFADAREIGERARAVSDADGVVFVPTVNGIRLPETDPDVRAGLTGLGVATGKEHVAYAFLEGVTHLIRICLAVDSAVARRRVTEVIAGGGLARSDVLMQLHADLLGVPVRRCPNAAVSTLRGAAFLSASDGTVWPSLGEAVSTIGAGEDFVPRLSPSERRRRVAAWDRQLDVRRNAVRPAS